MDDELFNRICMVKNLKTFLKICNELMEDNTFYLVVEGLEPFREKLVHFEIGPDFNFSLNRLERYKDYFNWMKISKNPNLKKKRFVQIMYFIPDLADLFNQNHCAFDWFKQILIEYMDSPDSIYSEDKSFS